MEGEGKERKDIYSIKARQECPAIQNRESPVSKSLQQLRSYGIRKVARDTHIKILSPWSSFGTIPAEIHLKTDARASYKGKPFFLPRRYATLPLQLVVATFLTIPAPRTVPP